MSEEEIKEGYKLITNNKICGNNSNWIMVGEYYQQFSIYKEVYETSVTNKI